MASLLEPNLKVISNSLDKARMGIDSFQREYTWQRKHMVDLINDLTSYFLDAFSPSHAPRDVENYPFYPLGDIYTYKKGSVSMIVDGQQRLTSLTLLLTYLHHRQQALARPDYEVVDLLPYVYSPKFGEKMLNIDCPDRNDTVLDLLENGRGTRAPRNPCSKNLLDRYADIEDVFPDEITGDALFYFCTWLVERVGYIEVSVDSPQAAYMVFEMKNDRGQSLDMSDLLKAAIIPQISSEEEQRRVDATWKGISRSLRESARDGFTAFCKDWFRGCYAQTIKNGGGTRTADYERVAMECHRWLKDNHALLGLRSSHDYARFVTRDMRFYASAMIRIQNAAELPRKGLESIYYLHDRKFSLYPQALLAPLVPGDSDETVTQKLALVADYLDIWHARRTWCGQKMTENANRAAIFTLVRDIRGLAVEPLSLALRKRLDSMTESFARNPRLRLRAPTNYRCIKHILARLAHWVDQESGQPSSFPDLVLSRRGTGKTRAFEIEHVWHNDHGAFANHFEHEHDFDDMRNRIGGLVLLQRGVNQSLGDKTYEEKRAGYLVHSQNLLTQSLHPHAYDSNPGFMRLIRETGLPFRAMPSIGPEEIAERTALYVRIAEWVWNPSRLDLDGLKAPAPMPLAELSGQVDDVPRDDERGALRLQFWGALLESAARISPLHAAASPGRLGSVQVNRDGLCWRYSVSNDETKAALSLEALEASIGAEIFDALLAERAVIEAEFGGALAWLRPGDKGGPRIEHSTPGGLADGTTWTGAISGSVAAMTRLHAILLQRIEALPIARRASQSRLAAGDPGPWCLSTRSGIRATGHLSEDGFVVKSGSRARAVASPSLAEAYQTLRSRLLESGVLEASPGGLVFRSDHEFSSPSAAASVLSGNNVNGLNVWRRNDGSALRDHLIEA
ncbi:hypothetical protein J2T57_001483 [Natronocella acetinitrilica]|uniref:DUF4357 domain-containing protein n=1 Tax=Natronocella acetinitrilica TaxID=414046 RepID=A0AAE3G428_9GAMM|nr:DUF4357 domain-containing protein [Natronocella acetinitrilica]MCP1674381.1 hypothetical protein [Natronocella acetinitrilica]